ncbi:MAG: hypothetical protein WA982_00530 [Rubrobacteraceae bacterium]
MVAKTIGRRLRLHYPAAALAFTSQLIHLWILPAEFVVRPLSGFFVLLVAICQGFLAVSLLFGPGKWTVRFGILINTCVVLTWTVTRFFGFPALLGFARLPVEPLNLTATLVETALLALLFGVSWDLRAVRKERRVR